MGYTLHLPQPCRDHTAAGRFRDVTFHSHPGLLYITTRRRSLSSTVVRPLQSRDPGFYQI
ncbi:hypothetical protein CCH79_00002781 [Gambusia affinis]|uniref:Uncharacterized protein n=1 Tax=Gambusia affinis TaxID=33528 RepID=A0A315W742_GAMAF|nr:hypothetical protein CCH79_00002781 [Gambusia affinis]